MHFGRQFLILNSVDALSSLHMNDLPFVTWESIERKRACLLKKNKKKYIF